MKIMDALLTAGVPFIMLLPAHFMFTQYWMSRARTDPSFQVSLTPKRVGFIKGDTNEQKQNLPFLCAFFAYKSPSPLPFYMNCMAKTKNL